MPIPRTRRAPHTVVTAKLTAAQPANLHRIPAPAPRPVSLYPDSFALGEGYPTDADVEVSRQEDGKGLGVYARHLFPRGYRICRISGMVVHEIRQHTLQISSTSHLYDPYFTGFLLHSCDPNTFLDMQRFELWAIKDIQPGEALTMDYSSTEDVLFKQFPCLCGSPNCRRWITGRREPVMPPASGD
jgi:uncharacterized protein